MFSETPKKIDPQKLRITHPLKWPFGWQPTPPHQRHTARSRVDFVVGLQRLEKELMTFEAKDAVVTSNIKVDAEGRDLPGASSVKLTQPGVSVSFNKAGVSYEFAYDGWTTVGDNLSHLAQHVASLRRIETTGGELFIQNILKSALKDQGNYTAPSQDPVVEPEANMPEETEVEVVRLEEHQPWWETLMISRDSPPHEIESAYTKLRQAAYASGNRTQIYTLDEAYKKARRTKDLI